MIRNRQTSSSEVKGNGKIQNREEDRMKIRGSTGGPVLHGVIWGGPPLRGQLSRKTNAQGREVCDHLEEWFFQTEGLASRKSPEAKNST